MPRMDGFAVAREIARLKPAVEIVFLTIHREGRYSRPRSTSASKAMCSKTARSRTSSPVSKLSRRANRI
jgi:DNA-binding LytR/AlgR family response regulator